MIPQRSRYNLGRWKGRPAVDPAGLVVALKAARHAGITPSDIARAAGMDRAAVSHYLAGRPGSGMPCDKPFLLLASTVDRLCDAIDFLVEQRRARLSEAHKALSGARGPSPEPLTRLPVAPLVALLVAQCGSVKGAVHAGLITEADRRQFTRVDTLDDRRAEDIVFALGVMPEEVWPVEWLGLDEGAA